MNLGISEDYVGLDRKEVHEVPMNFNLRKHNRCDRSLQIQLLTNRKVTCYYHNQQGHVIRYCEIKVFDDRKTKHIA